ncbi:MAG: lysozyme, partial [Lachnospiraceae bacterium]|nr:lysozyme [Lachnospiraceae bacterium]
AIAFCEKIKETGYTPAVYCNMMWEAYKLDLSKLESYDIWYADYEATPQTPYAFSFWQYSEKGNVAGVTGEVDMNLQLIGKAGD